MLIPETFYVEKDGLPAMGLNINEKSLMNIGSDYDLTIAGVSINYKLIDVRHGNIYKFKLNAK